MGATYLHTYNATTLLPSRVVTKTGMQTLIQQAMKNGSSGATVEQGTGAEIPFDPTSYRSVHFLAANTEKRPFEDLLKKTVQGHAQLVRDTILAGDSS